MKYDPINDTFVFLPGKEEKREGEKVQQPADQGVELTQEANDRNSEHGPKSSGGATEETEIDTDFENDHEHDALGIQEAEHENDSEMNSSEIEAEGLRNKRTKKNSKNKKPAVTSLIRGMKHLKKADGEPFWRRDIQYDFLEKLFDDSTKAFTNYFSHCEIPTASNDSKLTFSELYVRCLAESGKCSKILRERLLKDKEMGKSVGKVCLLVNAGRMNTTVNFVPEMRSTLRTYHSIPSLQADPVYGGSKPLQDTPRLKSILKAVEDVHGELKSLEDIIANPPEEKPNVNVVQLLFFLSNHVGEVPYLQEGQSSDANANSFVDFFLNSRIVPACRAKRLLWLLYTYLETSFKKEELATNPFNPDVIPTVELIPEDELDNYDKDTDFEIEYSEQMYKARLKYVAEEEHNNTPKRGNKSKKEREQIEMEESDLKEDQPNTLENEIGSKRLLKADDIPPRKRKQKANLINHASVVPSPLAKGVINNPDTNLVPDEMDGSVEEFKDKSGEPGGVSVHSNISTTDLLNQPTYKTLERIKFPIESLDEILHMYTNVTPHALSQENTNNFAIRNEILERSTTILKRERDASHISSEEFAKRAQLLRQKLFKFFQYKKSASNGLVGIEWEKIRYDLIHGIETTMYEQEGKYLSLLKERNATFLQVDNSFLQTTFPSLEGVGISCLPVYDFDRVNEENEYILILISLLREYFKKDSKGSKKETTIKFDLEREEVLFCDI